MGMIDTRKPIPVKFCKTCARRGRRHRLDVAEKRCRFCRKGQR